MAHRGPAVDTYRTFYESRRRMISFGFQVCMMVDTDLPQRQISEPVPKSEERAGGTSVSRLELPRLLDGDKFEPVPSLGVKARKQHQIKRVTNYLVPLPESDSRR